MLLVMIPPRRPSQQPENAPAPPALDRRPAGTLSPLVIKITIGAALHPPSRPPAAPLTHTRALTCFAVFPFADIRMSKSAEMEKAGANSPLEGAGKTGTSRGLVF